MNLKKQSDRNKTKLYGYKKQLMRARKKGDAKEIQRIESAMRDLRKKGPWKKG